jgi:tRNA G37 N-methylase Trm5
MERVTWGEGGQFFTPQPVVDLMTQMVAGAESKLEERVNDPCCGSGRFLISMAKKNPNALLYGNDIDLRCTKMTALNMWLFDLNARVTCGNGLTNEWSLGYETRRGGFIREILPTTPYPKEKSDPPKTSANEPSALPSESSGQNQMNLPL